MAMRTPLGLTLTVALTTPLPAQAPRAAPVPAPVLIKAGRLIDGRSDAAQSNVGIVVEGERIRAVGPLAPVQGQARGARVIDLSQFTVLPGFIDTHTHLLLQGDPTAESYDQQLLYQSIAYRAIRSEERRVGKECRARVSPYHKKRKRRHSSIE